MGILRPKSAFSLSVLEGVLDQTGVPGEKPPFSANCLANFLILGSLMGFEPWRWGDVVYEHAYVLDRSGKAKEKGTMHNCCVCFR